MLAPNHPANKNDGVKLLWFIVWTNRTLNPMRNPPSQHALNYSKEKGGDLQNPLGTRLCCIDDHEFVYRIPFLIATRTAPRDNSRDKVS